MPWLSEESCDDKLRLGQSRVWIIDPLDGTREYSEGRDDWAVHVALAVDGVPKLGAVAVPAKGRLFRSDRVEACSTHRERPLMLVSRTRPPAEAAEIAALLGAEMVPMGSAGAKAMAVVAGDADLYYHAGGQHEWDNCAPAAVALGAGLHASRVNGDPLVYNCADTLKPDLIIARPELAAKIVDYCRDRRAASARPHASPRTAWRHKPGCSTADRSGPGACLRAACGQCWPIFRR